ncbi:hypothetical protein N5D88_14630 [Aeromonas caviae]|uniref:hypothetical protein n=1 Tax=Aeromonas caviae TaxID=648 RepID=UPI0024482E9F|nr:hypothetical protein [Aeromonas caviae]MDH1841626.1 hypothetical protein [Aeromonas caviae]
MKTIIVCYNNLPEKENFKLLKRSNFFFSESTGFIISNTKSNMVSILDVHGDVIYSEYISDLNREMEFSGYHDAYLIAENFFGSINECLFLNDTIFSHGTLRKCERLALIEYKIKKIFAKKNKSKTIIGFLHKSKYLSKIDGFHEYINSKFFIIFNLTKNELSDMLAMSKIQVSFNENKEYRNNIYTTSEYSDFLSSWLNKGGWYQAEEVTKKNEVKFLRKARSIIHEHYMSDPSTKIFEVKMCLIKESYLMKIISLLTKFKY